MRYLTLSADYLEPSLCDDQPDSCDFRNFGLASELVDELVSWNADYQQVIPLDVESRATRAQLIDRLDQLGLDLADRISGEIQGGAKVRYYSEGWLRYLV